LSDWEELGRKVVADGDLTRLRKTLGLNRSSMSELLQTSVVTYTQWEYGGVRLWPTTAERIGRFYHLAHNHLDLLNEAGIPMSELIPLHHATRTLGVSQGLLLKRYREGVVDAEDLGILGLWLYKEDLERIRDVL
jgi:hypothetical protein